MRAFRPILLLISLSFFVLQPSYGQKKEAAAIEAMITAFKADTRGPYRDIRWFCTDGSSLPPQEGCPELGGVQRARYKNEVIALWSSNHLYLGQILSTTEHKDFWDAAFHHSRLKQFQLELFLRANDEGWINRKAQFYRGAYQVEDEEAWGIAFYTWLLSDANRIEPNFFLIRQSAKDIPHSGDSNLAQKVRALSKEISDLKTSFMDLRVKIHGQPEPSDIQRVQGCLAQNAETLTPSLKSKVEELIRDMEELYAPIRPEDFNSYTSAIPSGTVAYTELESFIQDYGTLSTAEARSERITSTALLLRQEMGQSYKAKARLGLPME